MSEAKISISAELGPCHAADFGCGSEITTSALAPVYLTMSTDTLETGVKVTTVKINWVCSMGKACRNQNCHYSASSKSRRRSEEYYLEAVAEQMS